MLLPEHPHSATFSVITASLLSYLLLTIALPVAAAVDKKNSPLIKKEPAPLWYQVEVLIFSQGNDYTAESETWRQDITLSYPNNIVELETPTIDDINKKEEENFIFDERKPFPNFSQRDNTSESAFKLLPTEQFTFKKTLKKFSQHPNYKPLFHAAWRQPMVNVKDSPAILIQGGERYNNHYELEGSISISVARYLHVTSNLWLTSFVKNNGQPQQSWPLLPPTPLFNEDQPDPAFATINSEYIPLPLWRNFQLTEELRTPLLQTGHLIERITVLEQSRRMRSKELHYLDHPLFGILVRINPYERPELQENY